MFGKSLARYGAAAVAAIERHGGTAELRAGDERILGIFGVPRAHEDDALGVGSGRASRGRGAARARSPAPAGREGDGPDGDHGRGDDGAAPEGGGAEARSCSGDARSLVGGAHVEQAASGAAAGPRGAAWRLVELVEGALQALRSTPRSGRPGGRARAASGGASRGPWGASPVLLRAARHRRGRRVASAAGARARRSRPRRSCSWGDAFPTARGSPSCRCARSCSRSTGGDTTASVARVLDGMDDADEVAELVAGLVGFEETDATAEDAFAALRRLIEVLRPTGRSARRRGHPLGRAVAARPARPPGRLDARRPILLLCLARPELLDSRPTWGGGKHNAVSLLLEPLREHAAEALIDALPGGEALAGAFGSGSRRLQRATRCSSSRCSL